MPAPSLPLVEPVITTLNGASRNVVSPVAPETEGVALGVVLLARRFRPPAGEETKARALDAAHDTARMRRRKHSPDRTGNLDRLATA